MWSRRQILGSGLASFAALLTPGVRAARTPFVFSPVPTSTDDRLCVPDGYRAQVLVGWGDSIGIAGATERMDLRRPSVARQRVTAGQGHDGLELFPLGSSKRFLVGLNHEFPELKTLLAHVSGPLTPEEVELVLVAQGVSIFEIHEDRGIWRVVPSGYARRVTGDTPMLMSGPAAGSSHLQTPADPSGKRVLGTFANCATGQTPWGTLLACEENVDDYFYVPDPGPRDQRYGFRANNVYPLRLDPRFDARFAPHERHRFGWVVEIDPFDPQSVPVKRTALGRFKHETATVRRDPDGRLAIYMGDDEAFEHLYKFVARERFDPKRPRRDLLDDGTLYVARLDPDGRGRWLPLVHASLDPTSPLTAERGFADQAEVLIFAREAATVLGATPLDRPEWVALDPETRDGYVALTNNALRGVDAPTDPTNPRGPNVFGQILRWREPSAASLVLSWDLYILAGPVPEGAAGVQGDAFACPDAIRFGPTGHLWIGTDAPAATQALGGFGHDQLLCVDRTGRIGRFLTAPRGAEVTGMGPTPDGRALFVAIQHPDGAFPDGVGHPPRSALVVVTREDHGPLV